MLNIALCDDDKSQIDTIGSYVNEYIQSHSQFATPSFYENAFDFTESIENGCMYDIALLDICMSGITGIEIGRLLKSLRPDCQVIFVTTSRDYAVEAIELGATHYLVKPFDKSSLFNALNRAFLNLVPKVKKSITFTGANNIVYSVNINDIIYIESIKHTKKIKCVNNEFNIRDNQENIIQKIKDIYDSKKFITIFRGITINLSYISSIETDVIVLKSGEKLPIAKRKVNEIKKAYLDFMVGDEI